MKITHHLNDDLLVAYAAGSLAEGWSLAVATHLALCPECRARLASAEAVGGRMLETIEISTTGESDWDAMKARLVSDRLEASEQRPEPAAAKPVLPQPLRDYLGGDIDTIRWQALGVGAGQKKIRTGDRETQVRLLRIPAGKPVPEHSHGGRELTVVLCGSFADGEDTFGPGDIEDADASLTHQPVAGPEEDCICLAVTDAPLRFTSRIVRFMQPFLGI